MATEAEIAQDKAEKAQIAALEAQVKADQAQMTPEQIAAAKAAQKADDAAAQAAFLAGKENQPKPFTAVEAGTLIVAAEGTMAGDHLAQKFGNDPANPKHAPGIDTENLVDIYRVTPDVQDGAVVAQVPKEMVGDYERAGWNRKV